MATDYIAVDTSRSYDSELAAEDIEVGEPATRLDGGGVRPLDVANDTEVDAVVGYKPNADFNERYETDYVSYSELNTYEPASSKPEEDWDDRVENLIPIVDKDVVRLPAIEDESASAPTFTENAAVGFVDLGNGPRLVEAGYTDGGTEYSESGAGDFVPVGEIDKLPSHKVTKSEYGDLMPVRIEQ